MSTFITEKNINELLNFYNNIKDKLCLEDENIFETILTNIDENNNNEIILLEEHIKLIIQTKKNVYDINNIKEIINKYSYDHNLQFIIFDEIKDIVENFNHIIDNIKKNSKIIKNIYNK
jgi:hypothetical protein